MSSNIYLDTVVVLFGTHLISVYLKVDDFGMQCTQGGHTFTLFYKHLFIVYNLFLKISTAVCAAQYNKGLILSQY